MKLHLMPRKLIINKITSVKAITDNNCVKELLRCVWSSGDVCWMDTVLYFHGMGLPRTKNWARQRHYQPIFGSFFLLFLMVSNLETNRKKNTSASKHGFIMSPAQIDENAPTSLVRARSQSGTNGSVIPFKVWMPNPPGWFSNKVGLL